MSWIATVLLAGLMFTNAAGPLLQETSASDISQMAGQPLVLEETERFAQTYPFDPDGRIEVSNINGSITIEAWDSPQISLEAVKTADTKERLQDVKIVVDATQSEFSVKAEYKSWKDKVMKGKEPRDRSKLSVDFKLKVPRTAVLKEIETINGSVTLSNLTNFVEVSAVNGEVSASNLKGNAKLSTVNGTVTADYDEVSGASMIALSTVNGKVKLMLPSNTNATVKADSLNGTIENDFGLKVSKGTYVGRDLFGKIGSGETKVKLNSVNGGIQINLKNDGGTPNPAVDLPSQKGNGDFDEMFGGNFDVEVGRINEDFERALVESSAKIAFSEKEIEKAMEAADTAMTAVKPEVAISAERLRQAAAAIDREALAAQLDSERGRIEAAIAKASNALYVGRSPLLEEKKGSFEISGVPTVTVDAKNCSVRVRGWDKQEVSYSVTRLKRTEPSANLDVYTYKDGQNVKLEVKSDGSSVRTGSPLLDRVRLEIFVPKKSNLKILTDGEVRLEGITGDLELIGGKGNLNVRDASGSLSIDERKGTVRVIGFEGSVSTNGIKGDVYLEGNFAKIDTEDGVGTVYLTLNDDASAVIRATELDLSDAVAVNDHRWKVGSVDLLLEREGIWKVGSGRSDFKLNQKAGSVKVRSRSEMFAN